jgi:hypothetical protein
MYPIPKRDRLAMACSAIAGVGDSRSASWIAIRESIELCRRSDLIVERLTQPVIADTPIISGETQFACVTEPRP